MAAPKLTTDEYFRTPETLWPQELIYGVVREAAAAPTPSHQGVVGEVYRRLWTHVEEANAGLVFLAPIDVVLDKPRGLIVQPDVIVVMNDRRHIVTDRVWGAPDLVVEVMSPLPRLGRLDERLDWFAQYGVRECWLLHQVTRQVQIVSFADGRRTGLREFFGHQRILSGVVPGFQPRAATLFRS
jgi:Uma2 family endonuclease